jgi:hypothetical protein
MNERIFKVLEHLTGIGQMHNVAFGDANFFEIDDFDQRAYMRYREPLELFQCHNGADPYLMHLDKECAEEDKVTFRYNQEYQVTEYFWPLNSCKLENGELKVTWP